MKHYIIYMLGVIGGAIAAAFGCWTESVAR